MFTGSKYPISILHNFENKTTDVKPQNVKHVDSFVSISKFSSLFAAIEEQLLNGSPPDSVRRVILCIQQKIQSRREDCKRCFNRQDYHRSGWLGVGELVKVVDSIVMFPGQIQGGLSHNDRRWITAALSLWVESRLMLPAEAYAAAAICFVLAELSVRLP